MAKKSRCTYVTPDGVRCIRPAVSGKSFCKEHRAGERVVLRQMARELNRYAQTDGVTELADTHVAANPLSGFIWELKKTAAKIIACEEQIAKLTEQEIVWGRTLEETKSTAITYNHQGDPIDGSYVMVRDQAALNHWVQLSLLERKHYAELCRIGIKAGLEDRRIALEEKQIMQLGRVIDNILDAAGLDPRDPDLRATIRDELVALERGA